MKSMNFLVFPLQFSQLYCIITIGFQGFDVLFSNAFQNDGTLVSEGVGRATGYQDFHKNSVRDARNTHNGVWGILEMFFEVALFIL